MTQDNEIPNLPLNRERRYAKLWAKILEKSGEAVTIKVVTARAMKTIRKAVWKEKNLDMENRDKYRVHCEMDEGKNRMKFWITKVLGTEDI
jgi:hypothetical protein